MMQDLAIPATLALLLALPGCLASCPTDEDAEARTRILSPEEPPEAVRLAKDPLDAGALADDATVRRRILRMTAAELYERLGSFKSDTRIDFNWKRDEKTVSLKEIATVEHTQSGDFRVVIENDEGFGMALLWVDGLAIAKSRNGHFFERRSDRAGHLTWRERGLEQVMTLLDLARGRLAFTRLGSGSHRGRKTIRYEVRSQTEADDTLLPPPKPDWSRDPVYPEGGPDQALRNRQAVWERGHPVSIKGELQVDEATGVVLAMDVDGVFAVPLPEGETGEPAVLELSIDRSFIEVGKSRTIEVPEHEPFRNRPRAVIDPLAWWPKAPKKAKDPGAEDTEAAPAKTAPAGE